MQEYNLKQIYTDGRKHAAVLALERPWGCAALLSIRGVHSVALAQHPTTVEASTTHLQRLNATLLKGEEQASKVSVRDKLHLTQ